MRYTEKILVVSGFPHISRLEIILENYFGRIYLNAGIPPTMLDEDAAAYGAIIQVTIISNMKLNRDILLLDIATPPLDIEIVG